MTGFELSILCLALNVFKEARGESIIGQQAVALVTLNRVKQDGLNGDVCATVFAPAQFSWTTTDTRNGVLLPGKRPDRNSSEWKRAHAVAIEAITMRDFTGGATFYHERSIKPYWVKEVRRVGRWGNHVFYKSP